MDQTSFSLSGVANTTLPIVDNKNGLSTDASGQEGDGFLAQLTQWFSGDVNASEANSLNADAKIAEIISPISESSEALFEQLTAMDDAELPILTEGESSELEGDAFATKPMVAVGDLADGMEQTLFDGKETSKQPLTLDNQLKKQHGEALLQRLDESAQALQAPLLPVNDEASRVSANQLDNQGNVLPFDDIVDISPDKILPISLSQSAKEHAVGEGEGELDGDVRLAQSREFVELAQQPSTSAQDGLISDDIIPVIQRGDTTQNVKDSALVDTGEQALHQSELHTAALSQAQLGNDETRYQVSDELDKTTLPGISVTGPLKVINPAHSAEVIPELAKKVAVSGDAVTKFEQDALLRGQLLNPSVRAAVGEIPSGELTKQMAMAQHPLAMNQTASAVQAAVNPQTLTTALTSIPWTPLATAGQVSSQLLEKGNGANAFTAPLNLEQKPLLVEGKIDQFAQQLALSFGNQGSTTASRLDNAVVQSPLQLAQHQTNTAEVLSERVNMMLSKNLKHVDIRLDPPELGRMQIKLSMNNDQASVQFTVTNQAAREMVEQSLPRLREMMQQQGLQLAQSSVQHQDSGGRQEFAGNQTQPGNQQADKHGGSRFGSAENEQEIDMQSINHEFNVNVSKDRVDYYA